ncbi:hypothetical protein CLU79DRAFT_84816 [Phycomyces nitens]|nr:hypothetical protein CLU79DRAFT_84816 [Phycomyces nitens]
MSSTEHHTAFDSLTPSAKLALLHAQTAAPQNASVQETMVPSANDPVVTDFSEPLIAGDYPTPISKPAVIKKEKKKDDKLDLASESAFPSLSSGSPRAPITSGWSAAAVSRVKTQPTSRSVGRAPAATNIKKSSVPHITDILELPANQQTSNQAVKPLGFKSNADVIQQVINKTGTTIIASTNRSGTTTFLIQGAPSDTEKAKRELIAGLVVKRTTEVAVPSSTRRFIIGSKGKTLQMIEAKSGTRINIPPRKEEDELNEETDEEMVNVTIVGDAAGIKIAQAEIEAIVGDKTAKQTIKLDEFHSKYHLLLAGPHNSALKSIEESLGVSVMAPHIVAGYEVSQEGQSYKYGFIVSGDKEKVQQAKQLLEDRYVSLKENTTTAKINIPKRQHKYLIGKNGSALREIFDKSGCTVELPSLDDKDSEDVVIRGPKDTIINGITAVMEKSSAVHVTILNLVNVFDDVKNPRQHIKNVLKYLVSSGQLKKIEQEYDVEVNVPTVDENSTSAPIEFFSKSEKNGVAAYQTGYSLCKNLVPEVFATVKVEPHLYHHISARHGKQLQRIKARYSVEILVPDNEEEDILIIYEGKEGDAQETKVSEAKEALEAVTAEIKKIAADSSDYISTSIKIPSKFHSAIRGPKGTTLNAILGEDSLVVVRFGGANEDDVVIRGVTNEVKRAIEELNKIQKEAVYEDFANSYSTEFEIPAMFSPHVIGKSGSNINKLKEDLGVKIDITDPNKSENGEIVKSKKKNDQKVKVTIQGIKTNVEAAKERISSMVNNLADQVILSLSVPKEFHRFLIGPSGRFVKKLEDKYNVYIRFPKSSSTEIEDPDVIKIRGRKKEASSAKDELFELYEYEKDEQIKRKERDARFAEERKKREAEAAARAEAAALRAAETEAEKAT